MLKDLVTKVKRKVSAQFPFLLLILSIISSSYFPAISRYNINTLFDSEKRGYFSFLFTKIKLREGQEDNSWVRKFGLVILTCFFLYIISEAFLTFYRERVKSSLGLILSEKNTELMKLSSGKLVNDFISFFSCFSELLIDTWAVISINFARQIKSEVINRTFLCLAIIVFWIAFNLFRRDKSSEEKSEFSSIDKVQKQLLFSELNIIFTAFYLSFFPIEKEVINAVLLGFNVSSLLNKLKKFVQTVPQVISTYKSWKETKEALSDKKTVS